MCVINLPAALSWPWPASPPSPEEAFVVCALRDLSPPPFSRLPKHANKAVVVCEKANFYVNWHTNEDSEGGRGGRENEKKNDSILKKRK